MVVKVPFPCQHCSQQSGGKATEQACAVTCAAPSDPLVTPSAYVAYTDGSCFDNRRASNKPAGWGEIVLTGCKLADGSAATASTHGYEPNDIAMVPVEEDDVKL